MEITAFTGAHDYGEHFKSFYGPTIAARNNAEKNERADTFDTALDAFCERLNRGTHEHPRFEKEYLLSVGTKS